MIHKKRDKHVTEGAHVLAPMVVLFIALFLFFYAYTDYNNKIAVSQNTDHAINLSEQMADRISLLLETGVGSIKDFSQIIVAVYGGKLPEPEEISSLLEGSMFDYIEITDKDGIGHKSDGRNAYLGDRTYIIEGLKGNSGVDIVFNSRITNETLLIFYTPLKVKGEVIGVLTGHFRQQRLSKMLEVTHHGIKVNTYMCMGDGSVIAGPEGTDGKDISSCLLADGGIGNIAKSVGDALTAKAISTFEYSIDAGRGITAVCPIEGFEFSIVEDFPPEMTKSVEGAFSFGGLMLLLSIAISFVLYITYVIRHNAKIRLLLVNENEEKLRIIEGINSLFSSFVFVSLKKDTYSYLRQSPEIPSSLPMNGKYSDFLSSFTPRIMPAHGEAMSIAEMLQPSYLEKHLSEGNKVISSEYMSKRDDGERWECCYIILIEEDGGKPSKVLIVLQDIDSLKKVEIQNQKKLEQALERADKASHAKTDFLSHMSHDIRTPMNAITGMTEIARKSIGDDGKVLDCLNKIKMSSDLLLSLINEVLDMSRIESGRITLSLAPFSLKACIDDTSAIMLTQTAKKNIDFSIESGDVMNDYVEGDKSRLEQIFVNILGNAVKFTPEGGKIKFLYSEELIDGKSMYRFAIKDNGIGMDKEFLQHIFEPFSRATDSRIEKTEGTGLGMAITHSIVIMMGGEIKVESEKGVGSVFTVTIPLKTAKKEERKDEGESFKIEDGMYKGKRLLLCEDNELNREIALSFLSEYGFETDTAADGWEAVECVKKHDKGYYDIILMDIQMPIMNGYDATKEIRATGKAPLGKTPIIAMTADAFQEDVEKALDAGMDDHISKPIDYDKFGKILNSHIK